MRRLHLHPASLTASDSFFHIVLLRSELLVGLAYPPPSLPTFEGPVHDHARLRTRCTNEGESSAGFVRIRPLTAWGARDQQRFPAQAEMNTPHGAAETPPRKGSAKGQASKEGPPDPCSVFCRGGSGVLSFAGEEAVFCLLQGRKRCSVLCRGGSAEGQV